MLAYDKKTIWLKRLQLGFEDGDDDETKSEAVDVTVAGGDVIP